MVVVIGMSIATYLMIQVNDIMFYGHFVALQLIDKLQDGFGSSIQD